LREISMRGQIIIAGWLGLPADQRTFWTETARQVVNASRAEPGCLDYSISVDPFEPDRVHIFERYESPEALFSHMQSAHFRAFVEGVKTIPVTASVVRAEVAGSFDSLGENALVAANKADQEAVSD
jgi:quinol monooxygenase YgiN